MPLRLGLLFLLLFTLSLRAVVLHVPDTYSQIQAALDATQPGDTVLVAPGHYHERLVFPNRDLTLASHVLLSGDTLLMDQTILDGDSLGTTVAIHPTDQHRYVVDGFTIRGGVPGDNPEYGGGMYSTGPAILVVRHVTFEENTNIYGGSGLMAFDIHAVHLDHIRLRNNYASQGQAIGAVTQSVATLRNLHVREPQSSPILILTARDTTIVSDIVIENQNIVTSVGIGTNNPWDIGYVKVRDIYFRNNSWRVGPLLTISSSSYLHARNIVCTDNNQWGIGFTDDDYSRGVELSASSIADVDSLFFLRNRATVARCAGGGATAPNCLVQHVTVEDCAIGDSNYVGVQVFNDYNALFLVTPGELRHSTFRRNRFTYAPHPSDPDPSSTFHHVLLRQKVGEGSPGNALVDCVFEDNEVIDLRDYSTITRPIEGVQGWGIRVESYNRRSYQMRNCVFRNNGWRNLNPEYPWRENCTESYWVNTNIGSFLYFDLELYDNSTFSIQNCLFDGNDEGGVSIGHHPAIGGSDEFVIENTVFRNLTRKGLFFLGGNLRMNNCLFDGIRSFQPVSSESEQVAFRAASLDTNMVRNCVFMNCNLPALLIPGSATNEFDEYNETARVVFDGCLFWNNTVERMEGDPPGTFWMPGAPVDFHPLAGVYRHSLLPEPMALQSNCLVDVDPQFDPLLGAPFLSAASPCVDAGNPDPAFDDPEDPAAPGLALFPALGIRRNDMGLFGGPLAVQTDTAWVALPAWTAQARPTGFHLGAPWPNPFNPVTQIPLTLERPVPVRLSVHNLLGQELAVLVNGILPAGTHLFPFQGKHVASGLYVVQLEAGGRTESRVMTVLR